MYNSITNYNNITHFVPYAKTNWNDDKSIKIPDIQDETYLLLKGKIMLEGGTSKKIIGNYKSYAKVYSDKIFINDSISTTFREVKRRFL